MGLGIAGVLLFLGLVVASSAAVALFRAFARRYGVLDVPNERSSHLYPIPHCGGVILVGINVAAWVAYGVFEWRPPTGHVLALALGGLIVAGISLIDDLGHVPFGYRLAAHTLAAGVVIAGFGYWSQIELPLAGKVSLGGAGPLITCLWIVGLSNAFNFVDGLDGMAAGQATVAGLGWMGIGLITGQPVLTVFGGALAATCLGFLVHNWHPASIFMGDVGSTFLGYSFAVVPILGVRHDPRLALAGVLLVWPAIFDASFTVLRRLRRGANIFTAHQEFLFHRLVRAGWSHAQAATLYAVLPTGGAGLALTWERGSRPIHALAVGLVALFCLGLWLLVRREERRRRLTRIHGGRVRAGREEPVGEDGAFAVEAQ